MTKNLESHLADFARVAGDTHILDEQRSTWPDGDLVVMECDAREAPPTGALDFYAAKWWFRATCKGCLCARVDRVSIPDENHPTQPESAP